MLLLLNSLPQKPLPFPGLSSAPSQMRAGQQQQQERQDKQKAAQLWATAKLYPAWTVPALWGADCCELHLLAAYKGSFAAAGLLQQGHRCTSSSAADRSLLRTPVVACQLHMPTSLGLKVRYRSRSVGPS